MELLYVRNVISFYCKIQLPGIFFRGFDGYNITFCSGEDDRFFLDG